MSEKVVDNGVNLQALLGAREQLTAQPAAAQFKWRSTTKWVNGAHSVGHVEGFYGLGGEQTHTKAFQTDFDHPAQFAATDKGVTPIEMVLSSLGSCLVGGLAAIAQNWKIQLKSVSATIEGDQDLLGILGADTGARNGFTGIRVTYEIDADAPRKDLEALVAHSAKRSAVFDIISNPTNVSIGLK